MNMGWIEVNSKDIKALQEHPLWRDVFPTDVFWHRNDCKYEHGAAAAGDIVSFTLDLHKDGAMLQAKNIGLKSRAQWWHAASYMDS
jgi:hypothetical protein